MKNGQLELGIVGLGQRGYTLLQDVILPQGVRVAAICDNDDARLSIYGNTEGEGNELGRRERTVALIERAGQEAPIVFDRYDDMLAMESLDCILVSSSWDTHIPYACKAMRAGKYCAMEVGGAYAIEDCWELVRTYEETGVPCMIMENCCYGRDELMVMNMVRQGLFGEVVHCEGGYRHDLRDEVSYGRENHHYRFRNYLGRNCDNYPTHELGPIANILGINRGNRMVSLVSMASKGVGLHDYLLREKGEDYDATNMHFEQGDVITTIIKCAHGETITMTLDTTLPRYYSRAFMVQGTHGMYTEDNHSVFLDPQDHENDFKWKEHWDNATKYYEQYDHEIWTRFQSGEIKGGHGGMDWIEFEELWAAVRDYKEGRHTEAPLDIYDAAAWMAITPLTEQSIALGSMPVSIPDFTCGRWMQRAPWVPYLCREQA